MSSFVMARLDQKGVRVFLCRKEEETQAPNHKAIGLHDGAIKQSLGTLYTVMIMYSQDKI
jgi:hypothetical protein